MTAELVLAGALIALWIALPITDRDADSDADRPDTTKPRHRRPEPANKTKRTDRADRRRTHRKGDHR